MRDYEIMFIVRPTLSEEDTKKVIENFKNKAIKITITATNNSILKFR